MKFTLDHIGLVVENIADFQKIVQVLNPDGMTGTMADPTQKVAASFVTLGEGSNVYVELLEPTREDSPVVKFLKKRGGGLHHLCFEVEDIDGAAAFLREQGFREVCAPVDCPTYDENLGRDCRGMTRIAFYMLTDFFLMEIIEKG